MPTPETSQDQVSDSFIQTKSGTRVISSGTYRFNTAYNTNLTGGGGGLFFGGPNAIAAYGGPVPLYTPNPRQAVVPGVAPGRQDLHRGGRET